MKKHDFVVIDGGKSEDHSPLEAGEYPLLVDGTYTAEVLPGWRVLKYAHRDRALIRFRIRTPGPAYGQEVFAGFNCTAVGRPGPNGAFTLKPRSLLLRTVRHLIPSTPLLPDQSVIDHLVGRLVRARTRTVKRDQHGRKLHGPEQYSVVHTVFKLADKEVQK